MRKVWKFGTRWSDYGTAGTSIFKNVFLPNGLIFATTPRCLEICEGDLFAVADGYSVIAIAEATTPGCNITKLRAKNYSQEAQDYLKDSSIYGCRVKYYLLDEGDSFQYKKMGKFYLAGSEPSRRVNELYERYKNSCDSKENLPRLFNWANKELAQDSFLCWILQCAASTFEERQHFVERDFGFRFVQVLLKQYQIELSDSATIETVVIKQIHNIDVACRVTLGSNHYALLIEDKVTADVYNNINDYIKRLEGDARFEGCKVLPVIVRTGDENIEIGGAYPYFLRQNFLELFSANKHFSESQILEDFHSHMQLVESRISAWKTASVRHWEWDAWKGFYSELQQRGKVKQNRWKMVAARGRGAFLCAFPAWGDDSISVGSFVLYWQFESDRQSLVLKLMEVYSKYAEVRDAFIEAIDAFVANNEKWKRLKMHKPPKKGTGYSMTLKIIDPDEWYGKGEEIQPIAKIEETINFANDFCSEFISAVNSKTAKYLSKLNQLIESI